VHQLIPQWLRWKNVDMVRGESVYLNLKSIFEYLERSASAEFRRVDRTVQITNATEVMISSNINYFIINFSLIASSF